MRFTPGHFFRTPEWRIRLTGVGHQNWLRDETSSSSDLIPYAGFVETSTRASSCCSSSARAYMSSANCRLVTFLPPMLNFTSCSSRESVIIR